MSLVENPYFIVLLGLITSIIPLMFWYNFGETKWLITTGLCIAAFAGWLFLERSYETDRESLYRTVYDYAQLVRENKIDELATQVDPSLGLQNDAKNLLKRYVFNGCGVSGLSKDPIITQANGQTNATIEFMGTASMRQGETGPAMQTPPIKVKLSFRKLAPGKWLVIDYAFARPAKIENWTKDPHHL